MYAIYFASLIFRKSGIQDIFASSRVVKFAIEEESNGLRVSFTHLHVYCTSIAYTSHILGVAGKFFACC